MSSQFDFVSNTVKSVFNADLRRFNLPARSFASLRATLVELYPELASSAFVVSFVDEENDNVTINSTSELEEAFLIAAKQGQTLKVAVTATGAATASASAPSAAATPKPAAATAAAPAAKPEAKDTKEDSKDKEDKDKKPSCAELKALALALLKDDEAVAALPQALTQLAELLFPALESKDEKDLKALPIIEAALASAPALRSHASVQRLLPWLAQKERKLDRKLNKLRRKLAENPALLALAKMQAPLVIQALPAILAQLAKCADGQDELDFASLLAGTGLPPVLLAHLAASSARRGCFGFGRGFGFGFGGEGHQGRGHWRRHCETKAEESKDAKEGMHVGIVCDGCGQQNIAGVRYKCSVCPDFDLCAACEAKDQHPATHPLIKMHAEKPKTKPAPKDDVHVGVRCDGCGKTPIEGVRFKCSTCNDFDLCAECEAKGTHPADHPLIKMRVRCGAGAAEEAECAFAPAFGAGHHWGPHRHPHHRGGWRHPGWGHGWGHRGWGHHGHHGHGHPLRHLFRAMAGSAQPEPEAKAECAGQSQGEEREGHCGRGRGGWGGFWRRHHGFGDRAMKRALKVEFVKDVNVPDHTVLAPSQIVNKTWEVRNTGEQAWPEGAKLVFLRGDRAILAADEFVVPQAQPGQTVEISVELRTPAQAGRYSAFFRLADREQSFRFGPRLWVDFNVEAYAPAPTAPAAEAKQEKKEAGVYPTIAPAPSAPAAPVTTAAPAAPAPAAVPKAPVAPSKWAAQLGALEVIGFGNRELNAYLLDRSGGNVQQVANWLLEKARATA